MLDNLFEFFADTMVCTIHYAPYMIAMVVGAVIMSRLKVVRRWFN